MTILVENSFALSTHLLKNDLRRTREHKNGVEGLINISYENIQSVADYYIEYGTEYDYLVIEYDEKEQRIKLAESELHFGPRSWFICDCDRLVSKLYLPPHTTQFKCRHCYNLCYQSTRISRNSKHGKFLYKQSKMLKLIDIRESIGRVFYRSQYTRRFKRWLRLCDEAGLVAERKDADNLMSGINS